MSSSRTVIPADQTLVFVSGLHPKHRRQIKAARKELEVSRGDIKHHHLVYDLLRPLPDIWR